MGFMVGVSRGQQGRPSWLRARGFSTSRSCPDLPSRAGERGGAAVTSSCPLRQERVMSSPSPRNMTDYEATYRGFRWERPEYFNFATDFVDRWASERPE